MKCGPHTLVTGKTDCGKSEMVKRLIREKLKPSGLYQQILVLDEKLDPGFLADFLTDDPKEFLDVAEGLRNCLIIIDEGAETVGQYAGALRKLATMYRGLGHQAFFITQRAPTFDKTMREQCSNLITFKLARDDTRSLVGLFPDLAALVDEVPRLEQGEYVFVPSFGQPRRGKVW